MIEAIILLPPLLQALLAGIFTWAFTALGAACVFFTREIDRKVLAAMLGLAGGVMVAASFWSLLVPALELAATGPLPPLVLVAAGFLCGALFLQLLDRTLPHLHLGFPETMAEGPKTSLHRTALLIIAMTIHNIPEGLAVGVAFGAVAAGIPGAEAGAAIALAIGIAIQNFPEGFAISIPLRGEGYSRLRSFWYGQLSAVVEPVAAVCGAALVILVRPALPFALAFAAGAMIFVVIEEVIPESHVDGYADTATLGFLLGFVIMMALDVSFA